MPDTAARARAYSCSQAIAPQATTSAPGAPNSYSANSHAASLTRSAIES